jgi:predicted dehydrogenase
MFLDAIDGKYNAVAEVVALCDLSPTRMNWHNRRRQAQFNAPPAPAYRAEQFDVMLKETNPDVVIVCSMDCTHHEYIIRALEAGRDAISEKPLTIDAPKARAILDAVQRTGRSLRVTFNYRYTPAVTKVYELLRQGVVGAPTAVDFSWVLDTSHGADYFRRWHREKDKSGGLLVHKATHHFDLVNWWLGSWPKTVFAMGALKFYGRKNAEARGEKYSYPRYTGHPEAARDPFALNLVESAGDKFGLSAETPLKGLYYDAEADSGYIRDRNVFGDNITIEDTMAVLARYRNGVIMNYSLIAYSPWEGLRVAITGTKGRVEFYEKHGSHIITGGGDQELAAQQARGHAQHLRVFPMFGVPYDVPIPKAEGGHGGGDPIMLEQLFSPTPPPDPFGRAASHLDGAASLLVGASANESIRTGQPVDCDQLLPLPAHS